MTNYHFKHLIQNPILVNIIAKELQYTHGEWIDGTGAKVKAQLDDMEDTLFRCQKDQFLDFRERKITFD